MAEAKSLMWLVSGYGQELDLNDFNLDDDQDFTGIWTRYDDMVPNSRTIFIQEIGVMGSGTLGYIRYFQVGPSRHRRYPTFRVELLPDDIIDCLPGAPGMLSLLPLNE